MMRYGRIVLACSLAALISIIWLGYSSPLQRWIPEELQYRLRQDEHGREAPQPAIWVHRTVVEAGLGSMMTQTLGIARMAELMGGQLVVEKTGVSKRAYGTPDMFNPYGLEVKMDLSLPVCRIGNQVIDQSGIKDALACDIILEDEEVEAFKEALGVTGCGIVVVEPDVFSIRMDLVRCTGDWMTSTNIASNLPMRFGVLGLHVRWGDMAPGKPFANDLDPVRTLSSSEVNMATRALKARYKINRIELYMEDPPKQFLDELEFEYEIVDIGTPQDDLRALASAEFKVLSGSSFGAMAVMMSGQGVFVAKAQGTYYHWNEMPGVTFIPFEQIEAEASSSS